MTPIWCVWWHFQAYLFIINPWVTLRLPASCGMLIIHCFVRTPCVVLSCVHNIQIVLRLKSLSKLKNLTPEWPAGQVWMSFVLQSHRFTVLENKDFFSFILIDFQFDDDVQILTFAKYTNLCSDEYNSGVLVTERSSKFLPNNDEKMSPQSEWSLVQAVKYTDSAGPLV